MKGKTHSDMHLPEPNYNLVQQAALMAELINPTGDSCFLENEPKLYEEQLFIFEQGPASVSE